MKQFQMLNKGQNSLCMALLGKFILTGNFPGILRV